MTKDVAQEINTWVYEKPYDLYSFSGEEKNINELLDGSYYSCCDSNGELIGYFCYGKNAQLPGGYKAGLYNGSHSLDIGIGLKPSLVEQGLGKDFLKHGLNFGKTRFKPRKFRLSVATFNKRAFTLYKNLGFKEGQRFFNNEIEFIVMEL